MAILQKPHTFVNDIMNADGEEVNENFDVLYDAFNGGVEDVNLGTRTIDDQLPPGSNTGYVTTLLGGLANRIRAIMGESTWRENPRTNLVAVAQHMDLMAQLAQAFEDFKASFIGIIVEWEGPADQIPDGWALCDGTNGTPDLRDKFIVGAGGEYNVGDTGGAKEVTLTVAQMPKHKHSGQTNSAGEHQHSGSTNSAGQHTHKVTTKGGSMNVGMGGARGPWNDVNLELTTTAAGNHSHTVTTNSAGEHSHTVTTEEVGGGQAHENRPPYYALCFIKRVA